VNGEQHPRRSRAMPPRHETHLTPRTTAPDT
jgi:hypothetical protein